MRSHSGFYMKYFLLLFALLFGTPVLAQLGTPRLAVGTDQQALNLSWESVSGASGYRLYYAPYPYTGPDSVAVLEMGASLSLSGELAEGSAYLVAVEAYAGSTVSALSNVEYFVLDNNHLSFANAAGSFRGLTLIAPVSSDITYLIDDFGEIKHQWQSSTGPGLSAYLLPTGNLLRTGNDDSGFFDSGGKGGYIEEQDWQGNTVWFFSYSDADKSLHHDIELLPNGNMLALSWEDRGDIWSEVIIEIEKNGSSGGTIVWRWDVFDHLDELGLNPNDARVDDWIHLNAIDYNQASNQILVSSRALNQLWVINKDSGSIDRVSTVATTGQHDAKWIDDNDANSNITVFDNGSSFSRALELNAEMSRIVFSYGDAGEDAFFSNRISGTQRLPNGNTLICSGVEGLIIELDTAGNRLRTFENTYGGVTPRGVGTSIFRAEKYATDYTPYF